MSYAGAESYEVKRILSEKTVLRKPDVVRGLLLSGIVEDGDVFLPGNRENKGNCAWLPWYLH